MILSGLSQLWIFFGVAVALYILYLSANNKIRNRLLLVISYVFYGIWSLPFLFLMCGATVVDFLCGKRIGASEKKAERKLFLGISVATNLVILIVCKYFNFFVSDFSRLVDFFGLSGYPRFTAIILPLGVSVYTLQNISYTLDIYRKKMDPVRNILDYALFPAFFPKIIAGPIEQARNFIPQILSKRHITLECVYSGCYLIFWGLFLKLFVADNLAPIVDSVFAPGAEYQGPKVLFSLYAFSFQFFAGFAGFSIIARGISKLMGYDLTVNFKMPYFSTNPFDYWRKWNISLHNWIREYIYEPMGGSKKGKIAAFRNTVVAMFLGALWYGFGWNVVLWAFYNIAIYGIYKLLQPLLSKTTKTRNRILSAIFFWVKVLVFFHITCLGWLFFRADSFVQMKTMLKELFTNFVFLPYTGNQIMFLLVWFIACFMLIPEVIRLYQKNEQFIFEFKPWFQGAMYALYFYLILFYGVRV